MEILCYIKKQKQMMLKVKLLSDLGYCSRGCEAILYFCIKCMSDLHANK